jgi:tRNA modification GTPase
MGNPSDTIYALASAQGRAGIAVVRVSGKNALDSLAQLSHDTFPPRHAVFTRLKHPKTGALIDECIAIAFHAPQCYTGENTVEYNIHGGKAVRESLMNALSEMDNHRMAEAGEFTRRAFENGNLDLTQAEAVADLIHAETEAQKQLALSQMGGALGALYQSWADKLVKALAYAEAQIDFSEEDLPDDEVKSHITPVLTDISHDIATHLNDGNRGEILRDGIKIAIIGAPNAGKSSLMNALVQRDVAIVSDMAGTTRDVLEVHLDLNGYPVTLFDTAGLRDKTGDTIEIEGIKRAKARANEADFKILLFDATQDLDEETLAFNDDKAFIVMNKIDLIASEPSQHHKISTKTGDGLSTLIEIVSRETSALFDDIGSSPSLTRARHREALIDAQSHLQRALEGFSPDLIAEDIRMTVRALGRITGRIDVEDLLDIIFRDFCIGK